jgi:hypothetical protein
VHARVQEEVVGEAAEVLPASLSHLDVEAPGAVGDLVFRFALAGRGVLVRAFPYLAGKNGECLCWL